MGKKKKSETLPFLFEKGLDLMFRQLPPEIQQYQQLLEGVPEYEAPEVLPNGDIIIRRKKPGQTPLPKGQIEL